jgi:hypothetical protein
MIKKIEGDLVLITLNLLLMFKTATSSPDPVMHDEEPDRLVKHQIKEEKDAKDLDMTVMVAMRPRDPSGMSLLYKSRRSRTMKLAVQILTPIGPAQEAKDILKAEGTKNLSRSKIINGAIINGKFRLVER